MKISRRWQCLALAGFALGLGTLTGCQTNVAGMTLPSGHYLQHPPQYFVPSPAFPLQRELSAMEAQQGPASGPAAAPPPAPAVAPPGAVPQPGPAAPPPPPAR